MLLTKTQATAVAYCLAVLKPSKGIAVIEYATPTHVKVVGMFDGSVVVSSKDALKHEAYAAVDAFRTAYGVA